MTIKNKAFFVTGAASGLGFATAQMIIENQGFVLIADLNEELGIKAEQILGKNAIFVRTDVTDEKSVLRAITVLTQTWENPFGVINCAGIAPAEKVLSKKGIHPLALFSKTISINLVGTFNVIRLLTHVLQNNSPDLETQERGIIINTASVAAFEGQVGQVAYAASKGGVIAMTLPLARELSKYGIRVMAIAPGIFETPMMLEMSEEIRHSLAQQIPFPSRLGKPKEFAQLVKHIIENPMLNGEVIRLDGAIRMGSR